MRLLGFGQYRVIKLKVPRLCCPWCELHDKHVTEQVKALQEKVVALEANSKLEQATLLAKLKVETGIYIVQRLIDGPATATADPDQIVEISNLYRRILELTPGLDPESNSLMQNRRSQQEGNPTIRELMGGNR